MPLFVYSFKIYRHGKTVSSHRSISCLLLMQILIHNSCEFVARKWRPKFYPKLATYVFSVPEVISSVTKITLFLSLFAILVSHESWNFTIFGCCNCFSISASSLNLARSAFEYLSLKMEKMYNIILAMITPSLHLKS